MTDETYGLLAGYKTPEEFLSALRRLREAGYQALEVYVPYSVEGMDELLPGPATPIGWIVFAAGLSGGLFAFGLQWYASYDYPLNVGGRPLFSWPAWIPVTFELTVLFASVIGLFFFFVLARLPRLHHPVFTDPHFQRASQDRFFLCIRSSDAHYADEYTRALLRDSQPTSIEEI